MESKKEKTENRVGKCGEEGGRGGGEEERQRAEEWRRKDGEIPLNLWRTRRRIKSNRRGVRDETGENRWAKSKKERKRREKEVKRREEEVKVERRREARVNKQSEGGENGRMKEERGKTKERRC